MADLLTRSAVRRSERRERVDWSYWLVLALAAAGPVSYALAMLLPYYANHLDRFPLAEVPWHQDVGQVWPYDAPYGFVFDVAALYALGLAPFVSGAVLVWSTVTLWAHRRTATWRSRSVVVAAATLATLSLLWLLTPLSSTLFIWLLD